MAVLYADPKRRRGLTCFVADPYEWEPRAKCYSCGKVAWRKLKGAKCDRCGGVGYVGEDRPRETMLAWDVAWSDEGHLRLVGVRTARRKGEALYRPHACGPLTVA